MTKISLKDKLKAVEMLEMGTPLRVVAEKFQTSIPLVHYWKKSKSKLLQHKKWKAAFSPRKRGSGIESDTKSGSENEQEINREASFKKENNQEMIEMIKSDPCDVNISKVCDDQVKIETNQITTLPIQSDKEREISEFQSGISKITHDVAEDERRKASAAAIKAGNKYIQLIQLEPFDSGLSKIKQIQIKNYESLKSFYNAQVEIGQILANEQRNFRNDINEQNNLIKQMDEYNSLIKSKFFDELTSHIEYLESILFFPIDE